MVIPKGPEFKIREWKLPGVSGGGNLRLTVRIGQLIPNSLN
jgi:hypothetical protein